MDSRTLKVVAVLVALALIGATLYALWLINTRELAGSAGFFGPGPLIADFNLALQVLLLAGLTFGFFLARRGNITAHQYNQTTWVLLNLVLVVFIMFGSMQDAKPESLADFSQARIGVAWLHALIGVLTVAGGLWLVLQMNDIVPKRWHIGWWKTLMRLTLGGYWAVALLGFVIYYVWYIG